jgi:hypothetical protein
MFGAKHGAKDQNEFDRLFNEPKSPEATAPAPAAQPQGPSEYTLMFKSPAKPAAAANPSVPAPSPRPAPASAAKPPANYMMLIYVLGGLLVVAIAVVAYLLLKK